MRIILLAESSIVLFSEPTKFIQISVAVGYYILLFYVIQQIPLFNLFNLYYFRI